MREPIVSQKSNEESQEAEQHERAIERLAGELALPAEDIRRSYAEALGRLVKEATVKTFLPVLVSRSVKERLQRK